MNKQSTKNIKASYNPVNLLVVGTILFPIFNLNFYAILQFAIITFALLCLFKRNLTYTRNEKILLGAFLFQLGTYILSFFYLATIKPATLELTYLAEVIKPIVNLIACMFFLHQFKRTQNLEKKLETLFKIISIIVLVFSSLQAFKYLPEFLNIYTKELNIHTGRASAPLSNPYDLGFILFFLTGYYYSKFILFKKDLFFFSISIICLLLTQSRSIFIVLILNLTIFTPIYYGLKYKFARTRILKFTLVIIASILSIIVMFQEQFYYLTFQFIEFYKNGGMGGSVNVRLNQIIFSLTEATPLEVLIGRGPDKQEMKYLESQYVYFFYRYGILGLIYLTTIIAIITSITLKNKKIFHLGPSLLLLPVTLIGNNFIDQYKLNIFFVLILTYTLYFHENNTVSDKLRE